MEAPPLSAAEPSAKRAKLDSEEQNAQPPSWRSSLFVDFDPTSLGLDASFKLTNFSKLKG